MNEEERQKIISEVLTKKRPITFSDIDAYLRRAWHRLDDPNDIGQARRDITYARKLLRVVCELSPLDATEKAPDDFPEA
ncbi:MAG: hypothetical protein QGG36_03510 [Pirellulaceae bacterium]|jgi:hypothetical protein|nr:hypothetical protein [Pirellulaceae bacterium]